ncbi:MAG TPA: LytTR family DNA-binding domain-containing protein [Vineibacter sp.]|nr:LytTR family DNA-binding domain-containing protein [Vineibacter sp.]
MRESSFFKGLPFQFLCLAIAAVVMAMIGPYGTFGELRLGSRLLYWALSMCAGWLIVVPIAAVFDQVEVLHDWPLPGRMALAGLVGGVPMTGVVWLLETLFRRSPPMAALPELFFQVAVLGIVVSVAVGQIVEFRLRSRAGMPEAAAPDPAAQTPVAQPQPAVTAPTAKSSDSALPDAFLRRLPPALGRDLLAVEMEDHYARIHTALGSTLILLRLRDAVAELGEGNGLQVHRSWWVAQGAVARVERDGGKLTLVLRNDLRVPVSKTYRDAARAFAVPSA